MDIIEPTVITAVDVAKAFGKNFVISTASTVGVLAGFVVVGHVINVNKKRKDKKTAKENTPTEK